MTELNEHHITALQGVVDLLPAILVDESAGGTSRLCLILKNTLGRIKYGVTLTAPSPHAIGVGVFILTRRITAQKDHRLSLLTVLIATFGLDLIGEASLKKCQLRVIGGKNTFSCTLRIHAGTIGRRMDLVQVEMVTSLPRAILLKFGGRDVVEVNDGCASLFSKSKDSRCKVGEFALYPLGIIRLIFITGSKRKEDRNSSLGTDFIDEAAGVASKGIDGFLLFSHFIINGDGVLPHFELAIRTIGRTGTDRVDGAVVVVTQFKKNVIALTDRFEHRFPQEIVESSW